MTASRIHLLIAALMGAAGVGLWAAAAHGGQGNAVTAAQFLLIHAGAIAGLSACRKLGLLHRRIAALAMAAMSLGALLFSGDLALRAFAGHGLFPMAAPSGGTLLILAWALSALAAIVRQPD